MAFYIIVHDSDLYPISSFEYRYYVGSKKEALERFLVDVRIDTAKFKTKFTFELDGEQVIEYTDGELTDVFIAIRIDWTRNGKDFDWEKDKDLWGDVVSYMDDDIREDLHIHMAPCTNREFIEAYIARDDSLLDILKNEFGIEME